ncbi:hypothetical protein PHJA_002731700 [Phtheirospermum japonicum]|uniref:Uncharacterized protein n=1 Tax=Phtheirospermum japonicum TaxID=374723 RepID=A0A830D2J7_9LAMI|nr:hypothetical protein PHJA_002731700 [Phtheirospermum japonicum]
MAVAAAAAAAFSANTVFPTRGFPPSSDLRFFHVNNNNKQQLNCFKTSTAAAPIVRDSGSRGWTEFGEKVSGEWDGFGAEFTVDGKPIQLPESVVPEAYREWDVQVFDWQTQCPTLATQHPNNKNKNNDCTPSLFYKNIKLLPTVGCEADAATTYTIQERHSHHSSAFAYQPTTGSYVALWGDPLPNNNNKSVELELEHCLIDPSNRESRVRVIQVLELLQGQVQELKLKSIRVFVEQWYGPFRNGDQLGGCAVRDSAFAATRPLDASLVSGVWEGFAALATFPTRQVDEQRQFGGQCARKLIRDEGDLILLPRQLWCSVKRADEDKTSCCFEVGWLLDRGRAITSKCTFSSFGEFKEIALASEIATTI